ncbi:LPS-assembly protein LptD [Eikenella sp. S3360]|uniref:LPS-assembly protein LptD n=2 Tax=Eikenella glucosivorans TaxID=2766967 RepID=A0ABS0NAY9_9NEIS|nr:LPS-assembly protein LptD [Eikenella glucosivorans]
MAAAVIAGLSLPTALLAEPLSLAAEGGAACHRPDAPKHMIAPAQTSGEGEPPEGATRVNADRVIGQSDVRVHAEGNVVVERGQQVLNAQWIDYDQPQDTVRAGNRFTLEQGGGRVSGENLRYKMDTRQGEASNARFEAESEDGRRLQGTSQTLRMDGENRYRLENGRFNTCNPGDESWYIRAKSIEADYARNIGVARNASLVVGGVPLFYTPWIDFPLNGNRKSGLLVPTFKAGSDGTEITVPYYFNLAPNYDLTLTSKLYSRRGLQLAGQFRYLQPKYQGDISLAVLPKDQLSSHDTRSQVDWKHQHQFGRNLTAGVDFHQVSDDDYYRDFYNRTDIATNVNLNRQLWLRHQTNLWGGSLSSYATVQKYQTLANADGYKGDQPYALLPRLSSQWQRRFGIAHFQMFGQYSNFRHDSKQEGSRLVLNPSISAEFNRSWGYIRPKAALHATYYDLESFNGQQSRRFSRVLPIFSVDSGMTFERPASWQGRNYVQTLEPRLFYTYIPTKEQNDIPLFDTSENGFGYDQLFRENRFAGHDRINAANFLTMAVQTRLYDAKNGEERFSAGIGQRLYFTRDDVLLDGSRVQRRSGHSDLLAFADGRVTDKIWLNSEVHYDTSQNAAAKYNFGLRYSPEPGKTVGARYQYRRRGEIYDDVYGKVRQADVYFQWPVNRNLYLVGRHSYSFSEHKPVEHLLGMEYVSGCGCWSLSAVGQHYVNGVNSSKNAFFLQLRLRDLSSLGNNPFEQLRQSIPGYTNIDEVMRK